MIETIVDDGIYVESPRWHEGAIWFSDIGAGKVRRVLPDGRQEIVTDGIRTPSGLGWTEAGDLLIAGIEDSTIYRIGGDGLAHPFCTPAQHGTLATNDMATAGGRSYVSCSGRTYREGDTLEDLAQPVGTILLLDHASGKGRVVAGDLRQPNGIAISTDGGTLIVAEVFARRILGFAIAADGGLSAPEVIADLAYTPDGLCLDDQGGIWIGASATGRFERIDAAGTVTQSIAVPGWSCIAPMPGGADGRDLILAVNQFTDASDIFTGRAKGHILRARL